MPPWLYPPQSRSAVGGAGEGLVSERGTLMAQVCNTCLAVTPSTTRGMCPTCAQANDQTRRPSGWRRYPRGYRINRAELLADSPPCSYCGAPATTADHVVGRADGGSHDIENLTPACGPCNSRRGQQQGQ